MDEGILNDLLECSVCLERLDTTSKVLPCQHTFCKECLEKILIKHKELKCPECRILVTTKIEDLPSNIFLIRLLEGMKSYAPKGDTQNTNSFAVVKSKSTHLTKQEPGEEQCMDLETSFHAKTIYDFKSNETRSLNLKVGDLVSVKKQIDVNWFYGECNGKEGIFPVNFVQPVTPLPSSVPQCKALYDFHMDNDEGCLSFSKGEVIVVIRRVDENWAEGRLKDKIGIFPISFVELNCLAKSLIKLSTKIADPLVSCHANQNSNITASSELLEYSCQSNDDEKHKKNELPSSPRSLEQRFNKNVGDSVCGEIKPCFSINCIALFSYKPQKADELELRKGETYVVIEKCQDGWYRGISKSKQKSGVFPGNYVTVFQANTENQSLLDFDIKNSSNIRSGDVKLCHSNQNRPPKLPARFVNTSNVGLQTTQRHLIYTPKVPIDVNYVGSGKVDEKMEIRLDKGAADLNRKLAITHRSKSSPVTMNPQDNPVFEDNIASAGIQSSTHIRSESCPNQISEVSDPLQRNFNSTPQRLKSREISSSSAHTPRSDNKDGKKSSLKSHHHRKSNSLDMENVSKHSVQCKGERYRCVISYPPNTEYELELQINDIVYVLKKRDDGWYKGTQQRTGRTGLFPASFVEKV